MLCCGIFSHRLMLFCIALLCIFFKYSVARLYCSTLLDRQNMKLFAIFGILFATLCTSALVISLQWMIRVRLACWLYVLHSWYLIAILTLMSVYDELLTYFIAYSAWYCCWTWCLIHNVLIWIKSCKINVLIFFVDILYALQLLVTWLLLGMHLGYNWWIFCCC